MEKFALTLIIFSFCLYGIFKVCDFIYVQRNAGLARRVQHDFCYSQYQYEIGQLERELRFEKFSAWTECPRCLKLDLHSIKDTLPHSCRRQCSQCKKVWRQI